MDISLRIYGSALTEPMPAEAIVSVGDVPEAFRSQPPLLVDEKKSWIVSHAQLHTAYILSSKGYRTQAGKNGQILICLLLSSRRRFALGVSPMDVLDALEKCFADSLVKGVLPEKPMDSAAFSALLRKYPLEERSLLLPVMRGQNTAAYCAENLKEVSAILRHSRYPQLGLVGRLEIGLQCESTISLSTKGTAQPRTVEKKEESTIIPEEKIDVPEDKEQDKKVTSIPVHEKSRRKEPVFPKPEVPVQTPEPSNTEVEIPEIPTVGEEVIPEKEIVLPEIPSVEIVPPHIPEPQVEISDIPSVYGLSQKEVSLENSLPFSEHPMKKEAVKPKKKVTPSSTLQQETVVPSVVLTDQVTRKQDIPTIEEKTDRLEVPETRGTDKGDDEEKISSSSGHKKKIMFIAAALLCLIAGIMVYIIVGKGSASEEEYAQVYYSLEDKGEEDNPYKIPEEVAVENKESKKEPVEEDSDVKEKSEKDIYVPKAEPAQDKSEYVEKKTPQQAKENNPDNDTDTRWKKFCQKMKGTVSQSLGGGIYIYRVSHTSTSMTISVHYPEYEMYNIDSSQRQTIRKNEETIHARYIKGHLHHGDGKTIFIRNLDKGYSEISTKPYLF